MQDFFSPFNGSSIASRQHILLVIRKSLQPSKVYWEEIYTPAFDERVARSQSRRACGLEDIVVVIFG